MQNTSSIEFMPVAFTIATKLYVGLTYMLACLRAGLGPPENNDFFEISTITYSSEVRSLKLTGNFD